MFYAIPLENRPSWRNPPWMTVLLILVNMLVFWGPQRSEENAQERAARYYAKSALPALELPAFVDWLERTQSPRAEAARQLLKLKRTDELLEGLQHEPVGRHGQADDRRRSTPQVLIRATRAGPRH